MTCIMRFSPLIVYMSKRTSTQAYLSPNVAFKVPRTPPEEMRCIFPVPQWLIGAGGKGRVAFMTYGRYQPAHIGHKAVFDKLVTMAARDKEVSGSGNMPWVDAAGRPASNVFVFASPTVNKGPSTAEDLFNPKTKARSKASSNPLHPSQKVMLLEKQTAIYQSPKINVINMALSQHEVSNRRDMSAAVKLLLSCYDDVKVLVGSDRMQDFSWLALNPRVKLISAGQRDPDAEGVMGMSSTKVRQAAVSGHRNLVRQSIGYGEVDDDTAREIVHSLRSAYSVQGGRRTRRGRRKNRKHTHTIRHRRTHIKARRMVSKR